MVNQIVIFSDAAIECYGKEGAIPEKLNKDCNEFLGAFSQYDAELLVAKRGEHAHCLQRLKAQNSSLLVSYDNSNTPKNIKYLSAKAKILPNPHLLAILGHLLDVEGWRVDIATWAYADPSPRALARHKLLYGSELIEQLDHVTMANALAGKIAARSYLSVDIADDIYKKVKDNDKQCTDRMSDVITAIIQTRFNIDATAESLNAVKIVFVAANKEEAHDFELWRRGMGATAKNSIIVQTDWEQAMVDPYRHYYYALANAYCLSAMHSESQALTKIASNLIDDGIGLSRVFSTQQIAEFRLRVLGVRFYGNEKLLTFKAFASDMNNSSNKPQPGNATVFSAAVSPTYTSVAVGYDNHFVYLHNFTGDRPHALPVKLNHGGKPYAMCYSDMGTGIFVVGKCIHYVNALSAQQAVEPLPIKLHNKERVVNITADHLNTLYMTIYHRGTKSLKFVDISYPYITPVNTHSEIKQDFIPTPERYRHRYSDIATLRAHLETDTGADATVYSLLCTPLATDPKQVIRLQTRSLRKGVQTVEGFLNSGERFELKFNKPYHVKVAPYRNCITATKEEGFVVAFVNADHKLQLYKYYREIRAKLKFFQGEVDFAASQWRREAILNDYNLGSQVTSIEFTPNCSSILCHTMNPGQADSDIATGKILAIRVPSIGINAATQLDPKLHTASITTSCGVPFQMKSLLLNDHKTPAVLLFGEKNTIAKVEIPVIMFG